MIVNNLVNSHCALMQRARNDPFNLTEFFQALPKKHHTQIWTSVFSLTQNCVMALDNEEQITSENGDLDDSQVTTVFFYNDNNK